MGTAGSKVAIWPTVPGSCSAESRKCTDSSPTAQTVGRATGGVQPRPKDTKFFGDRPIGAYRPAATAGVDKAALKNPPPVLYCIAEEPFCQTKG